LTLNNIENLQIISNIYTTQQQQQKEYFYKFKSACAQLDTVVGISCCFQFH